MKRFLAGRRNTTEDKTISFASTPRSFANGWNSISLPKALTNPSLSACLAADTGFSFTAVQFSMKPPSCLMRQICIPRTDPSQSRHSHLRQICPSQKLAAPSLLLPLFACSAVCCWAWRSPYLQCASSSPGRDPAPQPLNRSSLLSGRNLLQNPAISTSFCPTHPLPSPSI